MDTYLIADLTLKQGQIGAASELLGKIVGVLEGDYGWKLITGQRTLIGDINRIVDVWQVPGADAVIESLESAVASNADFASWVEEVRDMIVEEHLSIAAKTSYSP